MKIKFPKNNLDLVNYTEWLKERNRSTTTIFVYCQVLKQFWQLKAITTQTIRDFLKANIAKYKPNSLRVIRQALSSYSKFQKLKINWDWITGIIPKNMKRLFSTLSREDLENLKNIKPERNKTTHLRNNLIFDFLFYSGLRVSELINIKHGDWNVKEESLKVHGKGNKVRYVFLPPQLIKHMKTNSNDYLFTNLKQEKLSPLVIRQIIQQRIKKANFTKLITPHSFRRSFATWMHRKGSNLTTIQFLLGHDSITTTEKYIQTDRDTMYADYSKLWKDETILTINQ